MVKNYLLLALRNFSRDRYYAIINLFGLTIGLTSVILIVTFIRFQLSFDNFFTRADQTYLLTTVSLEENNHNTIASVHVGLGNVLKANFPEIQQVVHYTSQTPDLKVKDDFVSVNITYTNSDFFDIFNVKLVEGDQLTALSSPEKMVISKSLSKKIFNTEPAIGKPLEINGHSYLISAVMEDLPPNCSFDMEAVASNTGFEHPTIDWNTDRYFMSSQFLSLKHDVDIDQFIEKINHYYRSNSKEKASLDLVPLRKVHFSTIPEIQSLFRTIEIRYLYILGAIGLLTLTIAGFNYINLTIARSFSRSKEVGLRKTMGANRSQLTLQFVGESILFFSIALIPSLVATALVWPHFNTLINTDYPLSTLFNSGNISFLLFIGIVTGILSGSYPSYYLAKLHPINALKGNKLFNINLYFRKILIVGQFAISIFLIIATTVVFKQLHLLNNRNYGFDKDYLLALPSANFWGKSELFKQELLANPNIYAASISSIQIGTKNTNEALETSPIDTNIKFSTKTVTADIDFIKTLKLNLIAGRDFSHDHYLDVKDWKKDLNPSWEKEPPSKDVLNEIRATRPVIVSKGLVEALGIPSPLGHVLEIDHFKYGRIVGITSEFVGVDQRKINPFLILTPDNNYSYLGTMYVRIAPYHIPQTIKYIENSWKQFIPYKKFDFSFVDDRMQKLYETENRLAGILTSFAVLAISISILGLFSLVSIMIKQRTKEISIRKVMGAETSDISHLFSTDFVWLLILAFAIAFPVAWFVMDQWLADYAYRTEINWWIFILTGFAVLAITLLTINIQTVKAARRNPVDSLRSE